MFLLYPFYKLCSMLITLLCWIVLNPIVVLFVDANGNLPRYLSWFQTFDSPIPQGYAAGLAWLNRNPAYGFDCFPFGMPWVASDWKIYHYTNDDSKELFIATNRLGMFNIYYHNKHFDKYLKFGWKAWNYTNADHTDLSGVWPGSQNRVPLC